MDVSRLSSWQSEKGRLEEEVFEKKISANAAAEKLLKIYYKEIRKGLE
jgi:hypothetical protein